MIDLLAPQVGLEPTTLRLTAECSAIELLRSVWRGYVSSVFISNAVRCVKATAKHSRSISGATGPNWAVLFYPAGCQPSRAKAPDKSAIHTPVTGISYTDSGF